jgi:hypothetical protein
MSGFPAIDVAIGLIFVYFLLSVACSACSELLASLINLRGSQLRKGIINLLTQAVAKDKTGKEGTAPEGKATNTLADQVLSHPLIETLGTKNIFGGLKSPSYIPSRAFSLALLNCISSASSGQQADKPWPEDAKEQAKELMTKLRAGIEKYPDLGVGKILTVFAEDIGNDAEKLRERIETWFDQAMARVSGAYKRRNQLIVLGIALLVVVAANADTLKIAKTLSADPALRQALSSQAQTFMQQQGTQPSGAQSKKTEKETATKSATTQDKPAQGRKKNPGALVQDQGDKQDESQKDPKAAYEKLDKNLKQLQDLQVLGVPLGWKELPNKVWTGLDWLNKCVGLFLTLLAVSLGAPFWFDLLGKIVNIKGAGTLPGKAAAGKTATGRENWGAG